MNTVENKLRPITPVTYTNLGEWARGKQEVYVINDVTMTPEDERNGRGGGDVVVEDRDLGGGEIPFVPVRRPRPKALLGGIDDDMDSSPMSPHLPQERKKYEELHQRNGTTEGRIKN